MTIIEKLVECCNVKPTDIRIIGRTGFWTIVEYRIGGKLCQATIIID